jgi:hypothetical protein
VDALVSTGVGGGDRLLARQLLPECHRHRGLPLRTGLVRAT